jgi:lysine 2,3-aminomutase
MSRPAAVTTVLDLIEAGLIAGARRPALEAVAARYAVAVPASHAELINPDDPQDPLGLQYLPHEGELDVRPDELEDPIGDGRHSPVRGVVHRYPDRALLMPTTLCAVYCRFCFRRETVGPGRAASLGKDELERALAYIAAHPEIFEVILTGGDPLVLSARRLSAVLGRLAEMPHVKVLRVHTRAPVAAPELVTPALVEALKGAGRPVFVAVHVNHPRELTPAAMTALARLADAGLPLLSQTVLLKGVNDDVEVLEALMRALLALRVRPYYLHHPDLAPGTARFRLTLAEGRALVRSLKRRVSGLCQPVYVLDLPGGLGKARAAESDVRPLGDDAYMVRAPLAGETLYPPAPTRDGRAAPAAPISNGHQAGAAGPGVLPTASATRATRAKKSVSSSVPDGP